jgi:predicted nuclease of predicted toxin-antitoxin system
VKFLVDRCAGRRLAGWLQEQGHDVVEARERRPDPGDAAILEWGVTEGRIVVTIDTDFGELVFLQGAQHCGIVRLPDVTATQRIALMNEVLARHAQALNAKAVITVRGGRIRVTTQA